MLGSHYITDLSRSFQGGIECLLITDIETYTVILPINVPRYCMMDLLKMLFLSYMVTAQA